MSKIIILDENTCNKIAAGEVVENPASIVKELVENSIDAGALKISVEIENGGISMIKLSDDGCGIEENDVEMAFESHATSKIKTAEDLRMIKTLGFRGEALSSIASVSNIKMTTRTEDKKYGTYIEINSGKIAEVKQTGCPKGTIISVEKLFYNTPARFKFLKKDSTEAGYVSDILHKIAIGNENISITLRSNGKAVFHTPGKNDLLSAIYSIYGKSVTDEIKEINYADEAFEITGFAGGPGLSRANRNQQSFFINGRYIKNKTIVSAVDEAYKTYLMKHRYAFIVLKIKVNPILVDVNVHPSKLEARFSNERDLFRSVYHAVNNSLKENIHNKEYETKENEAYNIDNNVKKEDIFNSSGIAYRQQNIFNMDKGLGIEQTVRENVNIIGKNNLRIIDSRIIGQLFLTYILLECSDNFIMIDQHAAHERIMYEKLKKMFNEKKVLSQELISPVVIHLINSEIELIKQNQGFFDELGFKIELFGNNSVIIRSVPYSKNMDDIEQIFKDILDKLERKNNTGSEKTYNDILYGIACKSAIKANKKLEEQEIRTLIEELYKIGEPYTCPHGRPAVIIMTAYELEKLFKRKL